jgi:hypothetical protein
VQFSSHLCFHKLSCSCLLAGAAAPASRHVCLQFTWEVGLPSSPVEFSSLHHSHQLPRSWLLGARPRSHQRLSGPHSLFTYSPSPNLQCSVRPTLFPVCLYCSYCLLLSFSFSPWVEVSLSRGPCCSGPGLSVGVPWYHKAHLVCVFQAIWAPATGSLGALLVSLFNVRWRFSAPAGGVERSRLCLFSVIMPAKCVSGVSPRFHYRRLTFCFFPLAAILEFLIFLLDELFFSLI